MPRTSTKLYVHEFGFCTVLPLMIFGIYERLHRSDISKKLLTYSKSHQQNLFYIYEFHHWSVFFSVHFLLAVLGRKEKPGVTLAQDIFRLFLASKWFLKDLKRGLLRRFSYNFMTASQKHCILLSYFARKCTYAHCILCVFVSNSIICGRICCHNNSFISFFLPCAFIPHVLLVPT